MIRSSRIAKRRFGAAIFKAGAHFAARGFMKLTDRFGSFFRSSRRANRRAVRGLICFAAGTTVAMADGTMLPIEEVSVGDCVLCDHDPEADNGPETCEVLRTFARTADRLLDLEIESDGEVLTITVTPEHPFYDGQRHEYVAASELTVSSALRCATGAQPAVLGTSRRAASEAVYNLETAEAHNFFVTGGDGTHGVLVHNMCWTSGLDYEKHVRKVLGSGGSFKVGSREFDGRVGQLWYEVKISPQMRWSNWKQHRDQLGEQVAITRRNGRSFALFTPDEIPSDFAAWLSSKGIIHRILP